MSGAKTSVFKKELNWIKDSSIRGFVSQQLEKLPDYFFEVAASSTGKYHPSYALGEGGLVRHTKAAVAIAKDLLGIEMYDRRYTQQEKDIILAAVILHDGMKHGTAGSNYTVATHPTEMAEFIRADAEDMLGTEVADVLCGAIASHMGQFNTDYKTKREILPKPRTAIQMFVHQCDYLASRKYLEVNFDAINYEGNRV